MTPVKIIINEWNGYPLERKKQFGQISHSCGILPLLNGLAQFDAGLAYDVTLVITESKLSWLQKVNQCVKVPFVKKINLTPCEQYKALQKQFPFIKKVLFTDNEGMDIGAYNCGLKQLSSLQTDNDIVLMNSSVIAPNETNWLKKYQQLFYSSDDTGLCGISLNSHNTNKKPPVFLPHVQSFFLYTNNKVLSSVFDWQLPGVSKKSDKKKLIEQGEIGISQQVLKAGYSIKSILFPTFSYQQGAEWTIPEGDIRSRPEYVAKANKL